MLLQEDVAAGHELLEQFKEEARLFIGALELHELTCDGDDDV